MFFGGSPFEHFAGMHGGGDGGGGGRRGPAPDVDTTEMYQILGIEKDASENDIKKAYRKLALKVCICITSLEAGVLRSLGDTCAREGVPYDVYGCCIGGDDKTFPWQEKTIGRYRPLLLLLLLLCGVFLGRTVMWRCITPTTQI